MRSKEPKGFLNFKLGVACSGWKPEGLDICLGEAMSLGSVPLVTTSVCCVCLEAYACWCKEEGVFTVSQAFGRCSTTAAATVHVVSN